MKRSTAIHSNRLEPEGLTTRLKSLAESGHEQAVRRRRPLLVSLTFECPPIAPLSIFRCARSRTRVFWHQPADNMAMAGAGLAASFEGGGEARFQQTGSAYRRMVSEAHVDACPSYPLSAPVASGGFAFDPAAPPNPAWKNYPDALLMVPRFFFLASDAAFWCTINLLVSPDTDTHVAVEEVLAELEELAAVADEPFTGDPTPVWAVGDDTSGLWSEKVNCILEGIQRGAVQKVVLARELRLQGRDDIDVDLVLRRLADTSKHCVLFAIDTASGCMLGATPERLVRLQGQTVEVDCLAGSIARGDNEDSDRLLASGLLTSEKDRREHGWVVHTLREALMPYCSSLHVPGGPRLLQLSDVQHLHTPLQGTLNSDWSVLDLVARLHPTPGVGGVPRAEALDWIRRQEGLARGWYAGPIGWVDAGGSGEFVVGIRSALLRGSEAWLYAGCGIVEGSDPQREYEESSLKLRTMLASLSEKAL